MPSNTSIKKSSPPPSHSTNYNRPHITVNKEIINQTIDDLFGSEEGNTNAQNRPKETKPLPPKTDDQADRAKNKRETERQDAKKLQEAKKEKSGYESQQDNLDETLRENTSKTSTKKNAGSNALKSNSPKPLARETARQATQLAKNTKNSQARNKPGAKSQHNTKGPTSRPRAQARPKAPPIKIKFQPQTNPKPNASLSAQANPSFRATKAAQARQQQPTFTQRRAAQQQLAQRFATQQKAGEGAQGFKMVAQQAQTSENPQAQVRGSLAFVTQDKQTRSFSLKRGKEWSLTERGSSSPKRGSLSAKAEAQLRRVVHLRQRGQRQEFARQHTPGHLPHPADAKDPKVARRLSEYHAFMDGDHSGEGFGADEKFLLRLLGSLEGDKAFTKNLKKGENPNFPAKGDFATCFAGMMNCGNFQKPGSKSLDAIFGLLMRGILVKGKNTYLVADINYNGGKRAKTIKMAQIYFGENPEALAWLMSLQPGQMVSVNQLRQFFEEELAYTELAHQDPGAEEAMVDENEATLNDAEARERFALALAAMRRGENTQEPAYEQIATETQMQEVVPGFWAKMSDRLGVNSLLKDLPRLYTALSYFGLGAALLGTFIIIMMKLNN